MAELNGEFRLLYEKMQGDLGRIEAKLDAHTAASSLLAQEYLPRVAATEARVSGLIAALALVAAAVGFAVVELIVGR